MAIKAGAGGLLMGGSWHTIYCFCGCDPLGLLLGRGPGSMPGASIHLQEEPLHHGPLTLVVSSLKAVNTGRPAAVSG